MIDDRSPQSPEVIAAFQGADDTTRTMSIGRLCQQPRYLPEAVLRQVDLCQRIIAVRIEPSRDQQHFGFEPIQGGQHVTLHHPHIVRVGRSGIERKIERESLARSHTRFRRIPAPRITRARILMEADEQNAIVPNKRRLSSVAVVHVKIDDRNPADTMSLLQISRPDRNVGEEAKAHRPVRLGMMPRRANGEKCPASAAFDHRVASFQHRAHRQQRHVETLLADRRIALVKNRVAQGARSADHLDMLFSMNGPQPAFIRRRGKRQFEQFLAPGNVPKWMSTAANGFGEASSPASRTAVAIARIRSGRSG